MLASVATAFLCCGGWLAFSGRGVLGHLPGAETVIDSCQSSRGETIRLYEGNLGATTAYWYRVTLQSSFFATERRFFQAYSRPVIESVDCLEDSVALRGPHGRTEFTFSLSQVSSQLLAEPLSFYYGEPAEPRASSPAPRLLGLCCGSPLILIGLLSAAAVFRITASAGGMA